MPNQTPTQVANVPEEITGQPRRVAFGALNFRATFSALRHRNFRLFFFGQLVSLAGTWIQNTAQGWLVYQLTGSKLLLGTVAAVGSAPMLFFSMWGGSVADRHPKRTVVIWTQTAMMVPAFALAALVWTHTVQPWHILVVAAMIGVAMAFDMPARQAFMVEMTSKEDLMNAVSLNSSIVNGARVIGPAIAGVVMARVGMAWCFLLNGLSFLAVIGGLWMMRLPPFVKPAEPKSTWHHAVEGFEYVASHRQVRTLLILFSVVGVVLCCADAGICARDSGCRRDRIRCIAKRKRPWRSVRRSHGRDIWLKMEPAIPDLGWSWDLLPDAPAAGLCAELLPGADVHGDWRLGDAALFLDNEHTDPDLRLG
jgi:hypothetical protein